jgi:hypothetical protein
VGVGRGVPLVELVCEELAEIFVGFRGFFGGVDVDTAFGGI